MITVATFSDISTVTNPSFTYYSTQLGLFVRVCTSRFINNTRITIKLFVVTLHRCYVILRTIRYNYHTTNEDVLTLYCTINCSVECTLTLNREIIHAVEG